MSTLPTALFDKFLILILQAGDSCDTGGSWKEVIIILLSRSGVRFFLLLPHYPGGL